MNYIILIILKMGIIIKESLSVDKYSEKKPSSVVDNHVEMSRRALLWIIISSFWACATYEKASNRNWTKQPTTVEINNYLISLRNKDEKTKMDIYRGLLEVFLKLEKRNWWIKNLPNVVSFLEWKVWEWDWKQKAFLPAFDYDKLPLWLKEVNFNVLEKQKLNWENHFTYNLSPQVNSYKINLKKSNIHPSKKVLLLFSYYVKLFHEVFQDGPYISLQINHELISKHEVLLNELNWLESILSSKGKEYGFSWDGFFPYYNNENSNINKDNIDQYYWHNSTYSKRVQDIRNIEELYIEHLKKNIWLDYRDIISLIAKLTTKF